MMSRKVLVCVVCVMCVVSLIVMVKFFDVRNITLTSICDADVIKKLMEQEHQMIKNVSLATQRKQQQQQQQQQQRPQVKKDIIDNSPALAGLTELSKRFKPSNFSVPVQPDPNKPETITTWWQGIAMVDWYIRAPVRYHCKQRVSMGNWFICQDEPYTIKPPCLVYSFGINWEFTFDDAMDKLGCEVHLFDPSMKEKDHKRATNSTFHNMGIGGYNTDAFVPRHDRYVKDRQTWKIRTVKAIMKELGHENRVIDVFKMDIETYEWSVIDNMLESGVFKFIRQFDVEYHVFPEYPLPEEFVHLYQIHTGLREAGVREYFTYLYKRHLNETNKIRLQADVCYVNAFFDKNIIGRSS